MCFLKLTLVGALALTVPMAAFADQPVAKMKPAGSAPGIAHGAGGGSNRPAAPPSGRGDDWPSNRSHSRQSGENGARSHWALNYFYGFWGPPEAWGGPYTVWGGPYFPYRSYGNWDSLWYPYAEWRGPHGGWGNP
jgi:hypothetical protein